MSDLADLARPTQSVTSGFIEPAVKSPVDGKVKPVDAGNPLPVSGQSSGVLASNGKTIYPDNEAVTLAYTNGVVTSLTLTTGGTTYVQTLTYDGSGNVTNISKWVAQ